MLMPKHARPVSPGPVAAVGAIAGTAAAAVTTAVLPGSVVPVPPAGPALDSHVQHAGRLVPAGHVRPAADRLYQIRDGDTLSGISGRLCGTPADYKALAANNRIADPDMIFARRVLKIACHAAAAALSPGSPPRSEPPQAAVVTSVSGTLGCAGLERLWEAAGGNPAEAVTAASVAMAESGGRQYALSPTRDRGYWQINSSNGALSTFDAYGNARAAVALSGNGSNWSPWTTYTSGIYAGRC
jgi:Lysozyme like domain/LysM domain